MNTRIQGTAADLVKAAMILIDRSLASRCPDVRLVHQIHDELLFEVSPFLFDLTFHGGPWRYETRS